jgi:acetyl-CoA/propionyl-CoA carboxylase, biotin carboxylase, biotin carboxyl carrier protein
VIGPVLIANRGEIAVRVARTVRALGARPVAVFTAADAGAAHLDAAERAVRIGSYLDGDAVLAAARRAGAAAVHPGYGFLSENAGFARAVLAAGLVWVGPPPAAIELMGDKARAKRLARDAGVPVLPGLEADDLGLDALRGFGAEHGYPVVIKAVAGGGGKGMRVVRSAGGLGAALDAARREAVAAFGDGRVLVERFLERPRHIEVQVLADRHGAVLHLGERECSLQRRHQKVVEEAPSPAVGPELRERMGAAAVALARACGYEGAGTVEFVAAGGDFAFLEMNTRLQVEHPVTELVYGLDLVEQQLRVAAGEPLGFTQDDVAPRGHAVEARIYAEDPAAGFLPATGVVRRYAEPAEARCDSGVRAGSEIGTAYDPLLAKLIAHGPDRAAALARLDAALAALVVLGVPTSAAFTRALLARDEVRRGALDTGLLERVLGELDLAPPADLLPAGALALRLRDEPAGSTVPSGWSVTGAPVAWRREIEGATLLVRGDEVTAGERSWRGRARHAGEGVVRAELDGVERAYAIAAADGVLWIGRDGHQLALRPARRTRGDAGPPGGSLEAPMPGTVLLVHVANGDAVGQGDVLLVLESMKMELEIAAPHAGRVDGLALRPGDRVALRQPLVAVVAE